MGIHPVGGPSDFSHSSSNHLYLQTEYNDQYQAFLKNPTPKQAGVFYDFLTENKKGLTQLAHEIDYQPSQGASWANNLSGLENGLHSFMNGDTALLPSVYELSGQCATWIGIGQSPEDIVKAFDSMASAFISSPSHHLGLTIQWILNTPGYTNALMECSKDAPKTEAAIKECQKNIDLYENDPTNPTYTDNIRSSLEALESTLQ